MMEPILVENFHDFKTGEIVGGKYLSEKCSKIVMERLTEHFTPDQVRDLVFYYYELVFEAGEFATWAFTGDKVRLTPDVYNLEPTQEGLNQYGFLLPVIHLGSQEYDDICIAKGVSFEKVEPK